MIPAFTLPESKYWVGIFVGWKDSTGATALLQRQCFSFKIQFSATSVAASSQHYIADSYHNVADSPHADDVP